VLAVGAGDAEAAGVAVTAGDAEAVGEPVGAGVPLAPGEGDVLPATRGATVIVYERTALGAAPLTAVSSKV
jgi:hypothetical protein